MTTTLRPRQDAGTPAGGEFKAYAHSDQGLPTLGGRHAAEESPRYVPESLRMAHIPDSKQLRDLEWEVEQANADEFTGDWRADKFAEAVPNLHFEDAYGYYNKARQAHDEGGDWQGIVAEAAAADATLHPGGKLKDGYVPPVADVRQGYGQGKLTTGSKYTGYRNASEICKDIRADLKEATEAGYLPAGLSYSVTNEKYAGGQSVRVSIQGVSDADREHPTEVDRWDRPKNRAEADELQSRVEAIMDAYNRSDIDSMSDYFNISYHSRAEIETDHGRQWREREAAARKTKAAARAAGK